MSTGYTVKGRYSGFIHVTVHVPRRIPNTVFQRKIGKIYDILCRNRAS